MLARSAGPTLPTNARSRADADDRVLELPLRVHRYAETPFRTVLPLQRTSEMKKIAIAGFLLGLFGYVTARLFGKPRPKQISDRRSAAS